MRLYTVTVETTYVFASECTSAQEVELEFVDALRTEPGMMDELEGGDISVSEMSYLPEPYTLDVLPWGSGDGDTDEEQTIGQLIEAGAAPKYTQTLARLSGAALKPEEVPHG